ncbi:unnamed protein product [Lactuca saligna]|uniref:Uncharacterized protein n=1 Tax=Lactuca saligna TaxID=75948 RepID=A0AA35V2H0_LACSI|nr:unnamed protein product [Lactuca saligna]
MVKIGSLPLSLNLLRCRPLLSHVVAAHNIPISSFEMCQRNAIRQRNGIEVIGSYRSYSSFLRSLITPLSIGALLFAACSIPTSLLPTSILPKFDAKSEVLSLILPKSLPRFLLLHSSVNLADEDKETQLSFWSPLLDLSSFLLRFQSTPVQSNPIQGIYDAKYAPLSTPLLLSSSSRTTLSSIGTVSAPTFASHVGATSSTHASSIPTSSNQSSLPTSSTQSFVSTSIQSSTPTSTTSSVPTSTTNCSESVEENVGVQHQGYLLGSTGLDGRLYIGVQDKELFSSGLCSSVIYESFGERADLNGYSWAALSDETKLLYWDKFHKECH